MLEAVLGYKIMFFFDMPDGTKNGGITSSPESLTWIFEMYRHHNGTNLVIRDETIYKEIEDNPAIPSSELPSHSPIETE